MILILKRRKRRGSIPVFLNLSTLGRLNMAGIKDLWNREIVCYAMSHRMTQDLVGRALFRAVAVRRPPVGLIHHSD